MSRLIDADALIADMEKRYCKDCERHKGVKGGKVRILYEIGEAPCRACGTMDTMEEIDNAPTIEAEPVRHGHWINIFDENDPDISTFGRCTRCNEISKRLLGRYCRWCGAKMDEVTP